LGLIADSGSLFIIEEDTRVALDEELLVKKYQRQVSDTKTSHWYERRVKDSNTTDFFNKIQIPF
jgi:hypothetical protein